MPFTPPSQSRDRADIMEALFRRLSHYAAIGDAERDALLALPAKLSSLEPGEDVIVEGEEPIEAFVVSAGWAARYVSLEDGRAQVLNFMLPGDMFDLQVFASDRADHAVSAVTKLEILKLRKSDVLGLFAGSTRVGAALWWATLQEEAILREQIVRNGRRSAAERIAHLLLELHRRAVIAGEGEGAEFRLPITQALIADALGLSFVHVNRVIRSFVNDGYLKRDKTRMELLDRATLVEISGFDDAYLHLDADPHHLRFEY